MKREHIGAITFIGMTVLWILVMDYCMEPLPEPTEGIPHNYWTPDADSSNTDTIWE